MKHLYIKILLLPLLMVVLFAACKKDDIDNQPQNNRAPYDPSFDVFPIATAVWVIKFDGWYTGIDWVAVGNPVQLSTRILPKNANFLSDAGPLTNQLCYPLVNTRHGIFSVPGNPNGPSVIDGTVTLGYFRVDTLNNVLYRIITRDSVNYEMPVFGENYTVGDTLLALDLNWNIKKIPVVTRDSVLIGKRYFTTLNSQLAVDIGRIYNKDFFTLYPGSGPKYTQFFYKLDSLNIN